MNNAFGNAILAWTTSMSKRKRATLSLVGMGRPLLALVAEDLCARLFSAYGMNALAAFRAGASSNVEDPPGTRWLRENLSRGTALRVTDAKQATDSSTVCLSTAAVRRENQRRRVNGRDISISKPSVELLQEGGGWVTADVVPWRNVPNTCRTYPDAYRRWAMTDGCGLDGWWAVDVT